MDYQNAKCPDYSAHVENARDVLFPSGELGEGKLTDSQDRAIIAIANIEYRECEGH